MGFPHGGSVELMIDVPFTHVGPPDLDQLEESLCAIRAVVESYDYIRGKQVANFEQSWARYVEAAGAVGVGNGLDAIEICLRSAGVPQGSEVIVPAMSAAASALGVLRAGMRPVLVDILPDSGLLDLDAAADALTQDTAAVLGVHLYGQMMDLDIAGWCQAQGIHLIEDAAQAHGARHLDRPVGTLGTAAAWSFYPTKNLGALGDAGAVTSTDSALLERARSIANYGQTAQYEHAHYGMNSRLDELQAAYLDFRLQFLDKENERRIATADRYRTEIDNEFIELLKPESVKGSHVYHLFVVRVPERQHFITHMRKHGVQCLVHYPKALSQQQGIVAAGTRVHSSAEARALAQECASLPTHPGLSDDQIDRVIEVANSFRGEA